MKKILFYLYAMTTIKTLTIKIISLIALPLFSYSQSLTKTVDFSDQVDDVYQQYEAWCVYACWEALGASVQCEGCDYYVNTYIVPYYNSDQNPYHQLVDTSVFNPTMADYVADITSPCGNGSEYSYFGVLSNTLTSYFNQEVYTGTFIGGITDTTQNLSGPLFAISTDPANGTGHCVLFFASRVYNNDPYDPNSTIYFMDPFHGAMASMTVDDFMDEYTQYFR